MKDQLIKYIDLLFAGAPHAGDIKQEILQNTLDRYDDLIAQGKSPQAAYQLAISGIGDMNEILGCSSDSTILSKGSSDELKPSVKEKPAWKKALLAIGVCLYILCPIPLFVFQNEAGLCGLLCLVAVATALMIVSSENAKNEKNAGSTQTKESELRKAVRSIIWSVGMCIYLAFSFLTNAWYITWVIFPLIAAVQGLVIACMDLKEANTHET